MDEPEISLDQEEEEEGLDLSLDGEEEEDGLDFSLAEENVEVLDADLMEGQHSSENIVGPREDLDFSLDEENAAAAKAAAEAAAKSAAAVAKAAADKAAAASKAQEVARAAELAAVTAAAEQAARDLVDASADLDFTLAPVQVEQSSVEAKEASDVKAAMVMQDFDSEFDLEADDEEIEALDDDDLEFIADKISHTPPELDLSEAELEELEEISLDDVEIEIDQQRPSVAVEQRQSERVAVIANVQIAARARVSHGEHTHGAMTRDVSNTGLFLMCDETLVVGEKLDIVLLLPGDDDWTIDEHTLTGRVARVEGDIGYRVVFEDIPVEFLASMKALQG
ncbi:MAG: PilZ domain-containing protein [Myxococcales bacterium]|nr:PilZ domain-containing protein [Myxococcales bacterium]